MLGRKLYIAGVVLLAVGSLWVSAASAGRISDIRNTKHNFSSTATPDILGSGDLRTVKSTSESEICIFCHTPHGANLTEGPLWNREIPASSSYTIYTSGSIDSTINQPNGVSKLCLSCHDGSIAIGSVRNRAGSGGFQASAIPMTGTGTGGVMAPGEGTGTGYTRFLGTDLSNDHPISMTYNQALVLADGEMRSPTENPIFVRGLDRPGLQDIHLQPEVPNGATADNGQVQCISCHDPHIRDTTDENIKFLRLNRLQTVQPDGSDNFLPASDIICLACHTKAGWEGSAHAQPAVANETYTNAAADVREFAQGTAVWQTACLACHDTHTVQGSRRLLRGGTDGGTFASSSGYTIKTGDGAYAVEETCFACHSRDGGTLTGQGLSLFEVPDIKTDFNLPIHMPIRTSEQLADTEVHDIGSVGTDQQEIGQRGKDFIESQANLGKISAGGSLTNRHVECTDCHNPHRVTKRRQFNQDNLGGTLDAAGTHTHDNANPHTNIASGVLRGMWGVEPEYISNSFYDEPISFTIKRGDPGAAGSTVVSQPYVTREYQICLKCHSNYGYDEPPRLGESPVTTPSGTNGMTRYTNQAREYNSPDNHRGEGRSLGIDGGAGTAPSSTQPPPPWWNNLFELITPTALIDWDINNHRGWHPVMKETGRTPAVRNANANNWTPPFRNAVGTQTMYCTDCHGSNTPRGTADPDPGQENGPVWGPHGSTNNFLLKGPWSGDVYNGTGEENILYNPNASDHLCFKCHEYDQYASTVPPVVQESGFGATAACNSCGAGFDRKNYHVFHAAMVDKFRCNLCHVAVPHGWKNKAFLVNLNDVGPEAGFPTRGNQVRYGLTQFDTIVAPYTKGPYYNRAALKILSFARSGEWQENNCGSAGLPGNGVIGVNWMMGTPGFGYDQFGLPTVILPGEGCDNLP